MEYTQNELGSLTKKVPTIWGSQAIDRPKTDIILACSVGYSIKIHINIVIKLITILPSLDDS